MDYMPTTAVAKEVKQVLKKTFPNTKFSVRSDMYSGGSSIDVRWTNGASEDKVEQAIGQYHGSEFDGMIDLKSSNGRPYGNDYIFCQREVTDDIKLKEAQAIAKKYGVEEEISIERMGNIRIGVDWLNNLVWRSLKEKDL